MSQLDRRPVSVPPGKFRLDRENGKFLGVCAGLARHFELDPTMVRLGFVIGTLIGFGILIVVYLGIALLAE